MVYKHELYDCMLKILKHAVERLKARGNGVMAYEVDKIYQEGINHFSLPQNQLGWALKFICTEPELLPGLGQDVLNEDEQKAYECSDLKSTSTKAGIEAVKIAHERLVEEARLKPVTDARRAVDEAEALKAKKKAELQRVQEERDLPEKEAGVAVAAVRDAKKKLKQAEREVNSIEGETKEKLTSIK